ncbi:MAG: hypothetical protein O3A19_04110, partial [Planctomycetota bacterium]|nr:hypothetical protein [Planctomycetota bacterium]
MKTGGSKSEESRRSRGHPGLPDDTPDYWNNRPFDLVSEMENGGTTRTSTSEEDTVQQQSRPSGKKHDPP